MQDYIHIPINNTIEEIIKLNSRLDDINKSILNNNSINFTLYKNISYPVKNTYYHANSKNTFNASFYIKLNNKINSNGNCIIDFFCPTCFEKILPCNKKQLKCNHTLCDCCFNNWKLSCYSKNIEFTCPMCRSII